MTISIVSTTDSAEAVTAAMGNLAETKPAEEKKEVLPEVEAKPDETHESVEAEAKADDEAVEEKEETEESENDEELEESKPKKKGGFQKKLERAEKLRASLEQEKEYWRLEALRTKPEAKTDVKPDLSSKPKAESFNSHDEYVEALTDWKLEQKLTERDRKQKESKVKDDVESKINQHRARVAEFSKAKDDWDEITEAFNDTKNLTLTVQEAIVNSENGPAMIYELGKDPKELKRICGLSPIQAAMALGKIEARVTKSDSPKKEKLTTKAPAPITPVRAKAQVTQPGYRDDMSLAEFEKWDRAQSKARRAEA